VPESLRRVLPIGLLLALLYTLTNHARHHELTAIRAAGMSLWRLSLPYFAVGAVLTGASFLINEFWVPSASEQAGHILDRRARRGRAVARDQVRNLFFTNARENREWLISVYQIETHVMTRPIIKWVRPDGTRLEFYAETGRWGSGTWIFSNVNIITYEPGNAFPSNQTLTNEYRATAFNETPEQIKSEILISNMSRASRTADIPLFQIFHYLRLHPQLPKTLSAWLYTQLHGRIAEPFTCLVVVFIALPFGARSGRRNVFVGVAASIFIVFGFYVVLSLCMALGAGGKLPPWLAAWLPNLSFTAAAIWMIQRTR
jgi:lipopolysaccharide export system permease protein